MLTSSCICHKLHPTFPNTHIQKVPKHAIRVTPSEMKASAGILTCSSIGYAFRPHLRIDLPWVDLRCPGNLGFTASRVFTAICATYAYILTSLRSTPPHGLGFTAKRTLLYHFELPKEFEIHTFGTRFEPR